MLLFLLIINYLYYHNSLQIMQENIVHFEHLT